MTIFQNEFLDFLKNYRSLILISMDFLTSFLRTLWPLSKRFSDLINKLWCLANFVRDFQTHFSKNFLTTMDGLSTQFFLSCLERVDFLRKRRTFWPFLQKAFWRIGMGFLNNSKGIFDPKAIFQCLLCNFLKDFFYDFLKTFWPISVDVFKQFFSRNFLKFSEGLSDEYE